MQSRAYWLAKCSDLIYPLTDLEKAADENAKQAIAKLKALRPPRWKFWATSGTEAEIEQAQITAYAAVRKITEIEAKRIEQDVRAWGFDRFQFLSGLSTQCFIAANSKLIVICFRGTEPNRLWDVYDDAMALTGQYPQVTGALHIGNWGALQQVWRDPEVRSLVWPSDDSNSGLTHYLREFRNSHQPQKIWITGHSLGGALATVATARLLGEGLLQTEDIGGIYTFGQPRVGDPLFAESYELNHRHFRVVHNNDVVAKVPPKSLKLIAKVTGMFTDDTPGSQAEQFFGRLQYKHVGRVAFVNQNLGIGLDLSGSVLRWRQLKTRLKTLRRKAPMLERFAPGLADHCMPAYIDALASRSSMVDSKPDKKSFLSKELEFWMSDQENSPPTSPERNNLPGIFSGMSIGLLIGLMVGLSVSKVVGLVLGGLASSLALILGLNDRYFTHAKAIRIGTFAVFCIVGVVGGTYARTHGLLSPSYESQKLRLTKLGYQEPEALEILKHIRALVPSKGGGTAGDVDLGQAIHAGVLFGAWGKENLCIELNPADFGKPEYLLTKYEGLDQDLLVKAAKRIKEIPEPKNQIKALYAMHDVICSAEEGARKRGNKE